MDLAVGALGAAVLVWSERPAVKKAPRPPRPLSLTPGSRPSRSRGVVQVQADLTFEPQKVNIFNKDCRRGGKEVSCMSVTVCLGLNARTGAKARTKGGVGELPGPGSASCGGPVRGLLAC